MSGLCSDDSDKHQLFEPRERPGEHGGLPTQRPDELHGQGPGN